MKLFTIGFTKKSAERFFSLLKSNGVKKIIDVRLNNSGQLAGFAKGADLAFFAEKLCGIRYEHIIEFSPTEELLHDYKKKRISWAQYVEIFNELIKQRGLEKMFDPKEFDGACLLCSEDVPDQCHRRLLAEFFQKNSTEKVEIIHLV